LEGFFAAALNSSARVSWSYTTVAKNGENSKASRPSRRDQMSAPLGREGKRLL
jgi:hypothetical protein